MRLSANHNIAALNVRRALGKNKSITSAKLETLGSGLRITKASVDASGVAISEGFRALLTRMGQSVRNTEQASDLLQVAEGSLKTTSNILLRIQVLATQAASGHLTDPQRQILQSEFTQALTGIDRVAQATVYNNRCGQAILVDREGRRWYSS